MDVYGQTDGQTDRQRDGWVDKPDEWIARLMDTQIGGHAGRWTHRYMDRQPDERTTRMTDR